MSHTHTQFTIVGAGPYGLAVAHHLKSAGIQTRIFGKPMDFWNSQMPKGMLLRSPWTGSSIGDASGPLNLERYEETRGALPRQLPLEEFVRYGQWFQKNAVPDLDRRNIASIEGASGGYRVTLDDGESFHSRNVVVATGISAFAHRPEVFSGLSPEVCSHASDRANSDLGRFKGKSVAVIGAGQTATESLALLNEQGAAEVEMLIRGPKMRWLNSRPFIEHMLDWKLYPFKAPGRIGPIGLNWLLEHPALFTLPSRKIQDKLAARAIRPAASPWLRPRAEHLKMTGHVSTVAAEERGGKVRLKLSDGSERVLDHVLLGTGYKINISRYGFLSGELLEHVKVSGGFPVLNRGFESSLPGLYFVGATAMHSFGPYLRFVAGSGYAAKAVARHAMNSNTARSLRGFEEQRAAGI
jgi:cation diffusion facilitator CzcD-associated flavoprotein CzcO